MSDLGILILEQSLRNLIYQKDELEEGIEFLTEKLKNAYMLRDASLSEEDALEMTQDL